MIRSYYYLTKPGIIYSNVLTAVGGFFLASRGEVNFLLLLSMAFGLGFVIASACVFNNYFDRNIDAKMARTKKRALVKKTISEKNALLYGAILGILGFALLLLYTNILTAFIAFIGFFFYVFIYTFGKRLTVHGTVIGSISGAVPPVVGYCAVTNHFDLAALLLFFILVFWQMPHFYAIAIFRSEDYASASIPVLPLKKGIFPTKVEILFYIVAFIITTSLLTVYHYTGFVYVVVMLTVGLMWLGLSIRGFRLTDNRQWARKMFFFSLIIICIFSLLLIFSPLMP